MPQMTSTSLQQSANTLFVTNNNREITAARTLTFVTDFIDSVEFLPTTSLDPSVSSFEIRNQSTLVAPNTSITGDLTFDFILTNTANVQSGTVTLSQTNPSQSAQVLNNAIPATNTSVTETVNDVILAAGQQVDFTLSGTSSLMGNNPFSATATIRAYTPDEQAYFGPRVTNDFATVDLSQLSTVNVQPANTSYTISGSLGAGSILGLLEPADRPVTRIIETGLGRTVYDSTNPSASRWTRTESARTINSQVYNLFTLLNNGATGNYEFTVIHG